MKTFKPIDREKDPFLYCGTNGIGKIKSYWTAKGFNQLGVLWLIVSIPSLIAICLAKDAGYLESLSDTKAVLLSVWVAIAIFGILGDIATIVDKTNEYLQTHELARTKKIARSFSKWTIKTVLVIWLTGSPILWVWFLSVRHFEEYPALSDLTEFIIFFALIAGVFGCIADFWLVFGDMIAKVWENRESNLIGIAARSCIRGIGLGMWIIKKCEV